ncbi:hypothetical protein [Bifidobacterium oedipodis]|uniref:Uncharacterized protein n=1 Tax=Bifidobacterium oedipodis TaxID=2675322 RepID=A0A7Y0HSZ0_9BIFI|nr:hypothetical protein [Bifidobacterium sp. DSM 109957]NMM94098.1 hypothetical protein [Bifidobacterium sp. DSM 109957]
MSLENTHRYDDIIDMPHPRSRRHPPMSAHNRAAQFMPFAALTGYEAVIAQAAQRNAEAIAQADTPAALDPGA